MILYIFQCHSPKSSPPYPSSLPQRPKDCSIHLCLFCCLASHGLQNLSLIRTLPCLLQISAPPSPQYCTYSNSSVPVSLASFCSWIISGLAFLSISALGPLHMCCLCPDIYTASSSLPLGLCSNVISSEKPSIITLSLQQSASCLMKELAIVLCVLLDC